MKIFCIGRNYVEHIKELKNQLPSEPVVFMKPPTAILKNNRDFYYPEFSKNIQHEVEIVLKICKNGKSIQKKFAHKYYEEISLGIDFTARDVQQKLKESHLPWELAKGFDSSAVIGHFYSKLNHSDINNLHFKLLKNNTLVQQGNTAQMIYSFDEIISFISQYFTLQKGDLIYTGTPSGVSSIQIGDVLEGYLEEKLIFSTKIK